MAKKKKEPDKWVRLSNGEIEKETSVAAILAELRGLAVEHPARFEFLAQFVAGSMDELPDYLLAWLVSRKFVKPDTGDDVEFYDDVRDVIECCADWTGSRCRFDSGQLLHRNQSDIEPPEDD